MTSPMLSDLLSYLLTVLGICGVMALLICGIGVMHAAVDRAFPGEGGAA
jgi:Na+-transporting methylmalonyl-CoA/oxaloacetate decarboxylase gamma subunit